MGVSFWYAFLPTGRSRPGASRLAGRRLAQTTIVDPELAPVLAHNAGIADVGKKRGLKRRIGVPGLLGWRGFDGPAGSSTIEANSADAAFGFGGGGLYLDEGTVVGGLVVEPTGALGVADARALLSSRKSSRVGGLWGPGLGVSRDRG